MGRNVETMKTKNLFALFITLAVLLSGCGKANPKLESENAALKARVQKLEQQLKAANSQVASPVAQPAPNQDLKSQLEEAQKKAEADANQLQSLSSLVETQKVNIDDLMRELSNCEQATEKAQKDLQLYRDKATSALKEFKALRSTLGDQTVKADGYRQHYLAMQKSVTGTVGVLPESKVRRAILNVLDGFTYIDKTCEASDRQMQERTQRAQADYNQLVNFGGLGPNDVVIKMGKDTILAPAERENAAAAANRDQQIAAIEPNLDQGIKNLQALVNGNGA